MEQSHCGLDGHQPHHQCHPQMVPSCIFMSHGAKETPLLLLDACESVVRRTSRRQCCHSRLQALCSALPASHPSVRQLRAASAARPERGLLQDVLSPRPQVCAMARTHPCGYSLPSIITMAFGLFLGSRTGQQQGEPWHDCTAPQILASGSAHVELTCTEGCKILLLQRLPAGLAGLQQALAGPLAAHRAQ